jgi:hypothetical protein
VEFGGAQIVAAAPPQQIQTLREQLLKKRRMLRNGGGGYTSRPYTARQSDSVRHTGRETAGACAIPGGQSYSQGSWPAGGRLELSFAVTQSAAMCRPCQHIGFLLPFTKLRQNE